MRLNRFYLEGFTKNKIIEIKNSPIYHQIKNVLKMKLGDRVSFFCNFSEAIYEINFIDNKKIIFNFLREVKVFKSERDIFLFSSVVKKDKMEWIVQKAVELGVTKIIPVISDRSEKKELNLNRLNKISLEASEQCGRPDIVKIDNIIKYKESLNNLLGTSFLADFSGDDFVKKLHSLSDKSKKKINIFIGPEGGFSSVEIDLAKKNKVQIVSLKNYTLRSETATVAFLSLLSNL